MSTNDHNDKRTDGIRKALFSDSADHEMSTFVEKSGCQILYKSSTFSYVVRMLKLINVQRLFIQKRLFSNQYFNIFSRELFSFTSQLH